MSLTPASVAAATPSQPTTTVTFTNRCPACSREVVWSGRQVNCNSTAYSFTPFCGDCPDRVEQEGEAE